MIYGFPEGAEPSSCASPFIPEAIWLQYNFISLLAPGFNLYDISLVHPDFDVSKLYHGFGDDCDMRFRAEQQSGRDSRVRSGRRSQP
jgi:hypothetical protein